MVEARRDGTCVACWTPLARRASPRTLCVERVNAKDTFVSAVERCLELPQAVREAARQSAVEQHSFDQSYIGFLDTQIRLSPRGPEWTERLTNDVRVCSRSLGGSFSGAACRSAAMITPLRSTPKHRQSYIGSAMRASEAAHNFALHWAGSSRFSLVSMATSLAAAPGQ